MVIGTDSFILYFKRAPSFFEPWGQSYAKVFQRNWKNPYQLTYILFLTSILTFCSPFSISFFSSLAKKNNPMCFSKKPKSSQKKEETTWNSPSAKLVLYRIGRCMQGMWQSAVCVMCQRPRLDGQLLPPSAASLPFLPIITGNFDTHLQRPDLLCSLHFAHLWCLWHKGIVTSNRGRASDQGMPPTALKWAASGSILVFGS